MGLNYNPLCSCKVSVIVPVYNTGKWLSRCIDSILAQTFTDYELLLIDDGSTDGSGIICDEYAAEDKRIRVFHKMNGGVSSARNLGLWKARGEWIFFADADDVVLPNALEVFLAVAYDTDLIISEYQYIFSNGKKSFEMVSGDGYFEGDQIIEKVSEIHWMYWASLWNKIYKRSKITENHLYFDEKITLNEDLIFNFEYLTHISSFKTIKDITYSYCENLSSAVHKRHILESLVRRTEKMVEILGELKGRKGISELSAKYLIRDLSVLKTVYSSNTDINRRMEVLHLLRKRIRVIDIKPKEIPQRKIKAALFILECFPPHISDRLLRISQKVRII